MANLATHLLKYGVRLLCQGEYRRFEHSLNHPRETQRALLREILRAQEATEYGQSLGLRSEWDEAEFRSCVPFCDFNDGALPGWIDRQRSNPDRAVIAPGGIRIFEKTSGSSGNRKLIPYNKALLQSFERYFKIWVYDLLMKGPELDSLRIFMSISMSISPSFGESVEGAEKVGFEDDSQYLSPALRLLWKRYLTVPLDIKAIQDPDHFRDILCAHLASDERLEILSLWHPSLFTVLWEHLLTHRRRIATLVAPRNSERAALLQSETPLRPVMLWPNVKLVSAWDAGNSALPARRLQSVFPDAYFQGKGLLATEAPMTLPLIGHGCIPFITDVLFEFMDADGKLHWIDELRDGKDYTLVISQKGGLLRYRIRDRVRAYATSVGTPCLEFIGRENDTSDLVGEKLSAEFVAAHERDFMNAHGASSYLFLPLMPDGSSDSEGKPRYVLLAESAEDQADTENHGDDWLASWWEDRLSRAVHYDYARRLGQLSPVRAYRVPRLQHRLLDYYVQKRGMKAGDVKLTTLLNNPEESRRILSHMRISDSLVENRA